MISIGKFNQTLEFIRRSGACDAAEELLRSGTGGRPRELKVDVVFAAAILCFAEYGNLMRTNIHKVLSNLDYRLQREHGIRDKNTDEIVNIHQVRYLFKALIKVFTGPPTPLERHKEINGTYTNPNPYTQGLEAFITQLLSSTATHLKLSGSYAIDATSIASAARPGWLDMTCRGRIDNLCPCTLVKDCTCPADDRCLCRSGRKSWDPDAHDGHQTATFENKIDTVYGFHSQMMMPVPRVGGQSLPQVITDMRLTAANTDCDAVTLAMLDRAVAESNHPTEVLVDRAYSFKAIVNWQIPLTDRGTSQVIDMHDGDKRLINSAKGYLMIDGAPHCIHTPKRLQRLKRPATLGNANHDQRAAMVKFKRDIAERQTYALPLYSRENAEKSRYETLGASGKDACPECTNAYITGTGLPAQKNKTITILNSEQSKLRQEHYWGSETWEESYARRSRIEAFFGNLKGALTGRLRRGFIHQVGHIRTALMLALAISAVNLKNLINWAHDTGYTEDPITSIDTELGYIREMSRTEVEAEDLISPRTT